MNMDIVELVVNTVEQEQVFRNSHKQFKSYPPRDQVRLNILVMLIQCN